jgi:ubiquinone biosynthesis monooxygenase Coq7
MRQLSEIDHLCLQLDTVFRTLFGAPKVTGRARPDSGIDPRVDDRLSEDEKRHAAGLMRVDHCGEVCAQALYQGQALTARRDDIRENMQQAAAEENDHLRWCRDRVRELGSHTSYLDPLFYAGSFAIGAAAGLAGDRWSLGFVAATEEQVVRHIDEHLRTLPATDLRSRSILETMRADEMKHATHAMASGGADLPAPVKTAMRWMARVMTTSTYYL